MKKTLIILLVFGCLVGTLSACSKDEIASKYNEVLQNVGDSNLTDDKSLQGNRDFGKDDYVGSYKADYATFTGTEILFGGTALERDNGNSIEISCNMDIQVGTAKLIFQSGTEQPQVLCEVSDKYSETIELPAASNYILVECENFTGSVELEIK